MARQFEKPGQALKPASGFLHSGAPCPLNPKEINRGDYCHRFFICSGKKKLDPDQTVCLICNNFLPIFPRVDPLAQARVMGYTVGYKTIQTALAWEAKAAEGPDRKVEKEKSTGIASLQIEIQTGSNNNSPTINGSEKKAPVLGYTVPELYRRIRSQAATGRTVPKKEKPAGRGRSPAPPPDPGMKRCSKQDCEDPILPADTNHFYRCKKNPDGLTYYCKKCHNKVNVKWQKKKRAEKRRMA